MCSTYVTVLFTILGVVCSIAATILYCIPKYGICQDENLNSTNCFTENLEYFLPAIFLTIFGALSFAPLAVELM